MPRKTNIREKPGLLDIALFSLVFSVISIVTIFISVFGFTVANDFIFFNMQNITETLEEQGAVSTGTSALTQTFGDTFTNFNFHFDDLWAIAYIIFVSSSFLIAYRSKGHSYFSFLGITFYGLMVLLFFLTFFSTFTNWFNEEVLLAMLPSVTVVVPKFFFYLDHIGLFSAIHFAICTLLSIVNLDFAKINQRKKLEKRALEEDNEVV